MCLKFVSSFAILTSVTLLEHCSCKKPERSIETESLNVIESLFPHFTIRKDGDSQPNGIKPETKFAVDLERLDEKEVIQNMIRMQTNVMKQRMKDKKMEDILDDYDVDLELPPDWDGKSLKDVKTEKRIKLQEADLEKVVDYINGTYMDLLKKEPEFNRTISRRKMSSHKDLQTLFPNTTFNDTRRGVPILDEEAWIDNPGQRHRAYRMYIKLRILDCMVQIIYMAQYKITDLEKHKHLKPKDTVYRLISLHSMLGQKVYKLKFYHTLMMTHTPDNKMIVYPYLQLHHRLLKIYVDFSYMYWLFVRTHERHCWRNNIVYTHPIGYTPRWQGWSTRKPNFPHLFSVYTEVPPKRGAIKAKK